MREIVARAAVEPHAVAVLASDDAETVVLDFVQPSLAGWRLKGFGRQVGRHETVWQGHAHAGRVNQCAATASRSKLLHLFAFNK